jgi:hypothetical protein
MITYLPEPVSENRSIKELPRVPRHNQVEPDQIKPGRDKPNHDKVNDDDLELQRICEAIGLDVKEVTGEATPRSAIPTASHDISNHDLSNHDLSDDLRNNDLSNHDLSNRDLSNDVSADVLRLIEHVEATNAQKPGLRRSAGDDFELATPPVRQTRAKSSKPSNRESAQTPITRASDLADVLASLKLRLLKIRLAPDDMDEAQAEIATAIAQLLSPRSKQQIIALSLRTLLSILETAGPAALTKDVEASLAKLRAYLLQLNL